MRIKLSYTVDEENVLSESAKLIGLCGEDLQQALTLFNSTQEELKGAPAAEAPSPPNVEKAREMIEDFRQALLAIDTRLSEVLEIIDGFELYRLSKRNPGPPPPDVPPPVGPPPSDAPEENE